MEDLLLAWIRSARNRPFLLIIAGRLSGFHDWKRTHLPIACQVVGSTIFLHFDGAERLTISDAAGLIVEPNGELWVGDASEVRFIWVSDENPAKDCEEVFTKFGRLILFNRTDDLYTTGTGYMSSGDKFVVLR